MRILLCLLFFSLSLVTFGQKHAMNWHFGVGAGLSFNTYPPKPLTSGAIQQREGNATISDEEGNLLFYTDGSSVWNKKHKPMVNGQGLLGQQTAAQSCIIAKQPKNSSIYYLFTVSDWQNTRGTLSYSIVDVSLNSGNGEVIEKNVLVNSKCREQISAVYANADGDVWILSHEKNTANFVNYKLTEKGLETVPVISAVGSEFKGNNRFGQLKFSADGTKVCSTLGGNTKISVELFDFDIETGKLSNPMIIAETDIQNAYSSEFSPDGKLLYVTAFNQPDLYQFNLTSGNEKNIVESKFNLSKTNNIKSCLQIGYDHKIYVSKYKQSSLGVINNPNKQGEACDYNDNGIKLPYGSTGRLGFPNFIQSYFETYLPLGDEVDIASPKDTITEIKILEKVLEEKKYTIHFKTGSSKIDAENAVILDAVIDEMKKNPGYKVVISSHTDCIGSASSNLLLSQKRAKSSADYLNNHLGVKKNKGIGYGETKPLTNCECKDCSGKENSENRRTEINLVPVKK